MSIDKAGSPLTASENIVPDTRHGVILYVEDVNLSFDGFKALNNLNLYINDGELRCLIGANGAGKTTLMDVITGKIRPDTGKVNFGQKVDLLQLDESEIARAGIGRKFQKPTVFEELSVFENIELSLTGDKGIWTTLFHKLSGEQKDRIGEILYTIGLVAECHYPAGRLSHGQKQWLEIGMLLAAKPRVLLVDEHVAGMTGQETERTAELLTSLAGEHSVVVVDHDVAFLRHIVPKVAVFHQSAEYAEGALTEVPTHPVLIRSYLGYELT